MNFMAQVCGFILCAFIGLLGLTILVWIWQGKIDLSQLLSEANGDASMSRFQLLVFIFVIAISFFEIVENGHTLPDIPTGVLTLLGISASTYAVGKGISYSQPDVMLGGPAADEAKAHAAAAKAAAAETQAAANEAKAHAATAKQSADQAAGKQG